MDNKILLLGGGGFIGQKLINKVFKQDQVIVADMTFPKELQDLPNVEYKFLDYTNTEDFSAYLKDVCKVIHLISTTLPVDGTDVIKTDILDNVIPTVQLLQDMNKAGIRDILFVSSGGTVYGQSEHLPVAEYTSANPISSYGVQKLIIEKYLHLFYIHNNISYKIVRLANPYSSRIWSNRQQGVIPIFISKVLKGEEITIWGDGMNVRDYIHINDAIQGIDAVINYKGKERIFNIGTGIGTSLLDIIGYIVNSLGYDFPKISFLPKRKCDVKRNIMDISRIKQCTNWYPTITIQEGIKQCIETIRK